MTTPSTGLRAAAAVAVLGITAAYLAGQRPGTVDDSGRHHVVPWDGGVPPGVRCLESDAYASAQALALFGLATDGGPSYAHVRVCAVPLDDDAGVAELPAGMLALDNDQVEVPLPDGGAQFEAWLPGATGAPFRCVCAASPACEWLGADGGWEPAPRGLTLQPGQWRGACVGKVCTEFAGASSMPQECR